MKAWTGSDSVMAVVTGNFVADTILSPLAKLEPVLHSCLVVVQILVALASAVYIGFKIWSVKKTEQRQEILFEAEHEPKTKKTTSGAPRKRRARPGD